MSKNNLIALVALLVVIITAFIGYSFFTSRKSENEKIVFENKLKCEKYIDQAKNEVLEQSKLMEDASKVFGVKLSKPVVGKIFYSPIENTCLYEISKYDEGKAMPSLVNIVDVLTNNYIETFIETDTMSDFKGNPSRYEKYLRDRNAWN